MATVCATMTFPRCCYCKRLFFSQIVFPLLALSAADTLAAAEQFDLSESVTDSRVFNITTTMKASGQLQTALGGGKAVGLKLQVEGRFQYRERRLAGAGRDAQALRTVRHYDRAEATITVNGHPTFSQLSRENKLIVAHGKREGPTLYSPNGPLTYGELELLRSPGDSLAVPALLPRKKVSVGQKWNPDRWVIQMLTGVEAVLKDELACQLESAEAQVAKVTFSGQIEGANLGAATTVKVSGHYLFDLKGQYVRHIELSQSEKRSVGTVSPGIDVTAKLVLDRRPTNRIDPLTDATIERIPLEPTAKLLQLRFESSWKIRFTYARDWHIFHQTSDVAVLRLLDKGSLIAQCNISPVPSASPGQRTPDDQFQTDIRAALGDKLRTISNAEQIRTEKNRFLYSVTAVGESNGRPMHWHYHLCTAPSGQQVALVFAVETQMLERLGDRELMLVNGLQFLANSLSENTKR